MLQFREKIETISDAVQFLATVVSSENILDECSFETQTPAQIIEYTLMNEIRATAKLGSYSGIVYIYNNNNQLYNPRVEGLTPTSGGTIIIDT